MSTLRNLLLVSSVALGSAGAACGKDAASVAHPEGKLQVSVSALSLPGVVDAEYGLEVYNAAGDLVWREPSLRASQYGAPNGGSIAYVGTCDASSNDNRVELTVVALYDTPTHALPASRWQNPTAGGPLVEHVTCVENADVPVQFDLTILRAAEQGFFDIGVTFSDIFCSAKVDCKDELLHNPATGEREATVVMALACTSGAGDPTWLHYSDVALKCGDTVTWLDPSVGPGQVGGAPPALYQVATYRGQEQLEGLDKCYWNMALGVNLGTNASSCSLVAYATASTDPFDAEGSTPAHSTYPYVAYEVALTDAAGAFVCSSHPLNGTPAGVSTGYTSPAGTRFPFQWECDDDTTITTNRITCSGLAASSAAGAATFTQNPGGLTFGVGNLKSPLLKLPADRKLSACCANPCPDCQVQATTP